MGLQEALQQVLPKLTIDYIILVRQSAEVMKLIRNAFKADEHFFMENKQGYEAVHTYRSILIHAEEKAKEGTREDREGLSDVKKFGCYSLTVAVGVMEGYIAKL